MGVPLVATLLAPLWVVNATSLAMDAVIVQVPPPPPPAKGALPGDSAPAVDQMGQGQALRRIVTDDAESSGRSVFCPSPSPKWIAPSSLGPGVERWM